MKHTVWSGVGRVEDTQRVHLAHLFPSIDCTQTRCGRRGQGSFGSRRRRRVCSVLTAVAWTAVASQNSRHAMAATCAYLKCGSHKIISFAYGPIEIRSRFSLLQDALGPKSGRVIVHVASPGESVADEVDELLAVLAPGTAGTRFIRVARLRSSSKGQPAWLQSIGFAPSSGLTLGWGGCLRAPILCQAFRSPASLPLGPCSAGVVPGWRTTVHAFLPKRVGNRAGKPGAAHSPLAAAFAGRVWSWVFE